MNVRLLVWGSTAVAAQVASAVVLAKVTRAARADSTKPRLPEGRRDLVAAVRR